MVSNMRALSFSSRTLPADESLKITVCFIANMSYLIIQAFCTLSKKLNDGKNSKKPAQEKNSAKFCPKTQPIVGFSSLKNQKKNPSMKKNWHFCSQNSIFFLENIFTTFTQGFSSDIRALTQA